MELTNEQKTLLKAYDGKFYIARRNKKLVPNASTKFMIFSLPAIITCPNRCDACEKCCYAVKSEKAYPDCLPSRHRNLDFTKCVDFVDVMSAYIHKASDHHLYKKAKRIVFRIHESGDFYSQAYYNAWLQIARNCSDIENLVFMAYTKSIHFVANGGDIPANMTIRFSLWNDTEIKGEMYKGTKPEDYELAKALNMPIYTAVESFTTESKKNRCECVDCGTCNKCWCSAIDTLLCEIH